MTSNKDASAPTTDIPFDPVSSSLMTMVATLSGRVVGVFSGKVARTSVSATDVGDSLTSVTSRTYITVTGVLPRTVASAIVTVTE